MRSALDFNLHQGFELFIKLILKIEGSSYHRIHKLVDLFDMVTKASRDAFDACCREHFHGVPEGKTIHLVAFKRAANRPPLPTSNPLGFNTLRGTLDFFDNELALYKRRYAWESVGKGEWRHFVVDVGPWIAVLRGIAGHCGSAITEFGKSQHRDSGSLIP